MVLIFSGPTDINLPTNTFFITAAADADVSIPAANFDAIAFGCGENYINVHSAENPSGEIRAQVAPSMTQVIRTELEGSQDPQGVDTLANPGAAGVAYVTIDNANPADLTIVVNVIVDGFDADLSLNGTPSPQSPVHLHRNFSGMNGPIAVGALQGILEQAPVDSNIFYQLAQYL